MSLPKISSAKGPKNALSYFRFYLIANWQQFVLYLILSFLAMVLPTILSISEAQRWQNYNTSGLDEAQAICTIYVVVSGILGIFSGMSANSYVNSKQATNCFHSVPMRRETLFVTEGVARFCYYLISSSCAYFSSMFLMLVAFGRWENCFGMIFSLWIVGILGYLIVFTLFQLAGALTATAVFRFCMAGLIAFLPIALHFLLMGCINVSMDSINTEYYMDLPTLRWICPAYMILYVALGLLAGEISYPVLQILSLLVPSIIFYTAAILIHRERRSEMAANSVIWNKVKVIVKYLVVFTAGVCGALLMYGGFGSGFSWMIFGTICGLVLSFILMNVLIDRSTKSMFKGIAGLGITTVVTGLFLLVFLFDIFHMDNFLYSANNIREIELQFNGFEEEIVLTEEEDIARILPALQNINGITYIDADYAVAELDKIINTDEETREKIHTYFSGHFDDDSQAYLLDNYSGYLKNYMKYMYEAETEAIVVGEQVATESYDAPSVSIEQALYYMETSSFNSRRIYYTIKPKFGIPLAKYGRIHPLADAAKHFENLAFTQAYQDYIAEVESRIAADDVFDITIEYSADYLDQNTSKQSRMMANGKTFKENLIQVYKEAVPAHIDSSLIGNIHFYAGTGSTYSLPLHAGMTEVLDLIADGCRLSYLVFDHYDNYSVPEENYCHAGEDFIDWAGEKYEGFLIVERGTGRSWYTEDENEMHEILSCATNIRYSGFNLLSGAGDREYMLAGVRTKNPNEEYAYIELMLFREDAIPACVTDIFS